MLSVTIVDSTWIVIIEAFSPVFNLVNESLHDIFEFCSIVTNVKQNKMVLRAELTQLSH
jgi:hypothetical protein